MRWWLVRCQPPRPSPVPGTLVQYEVDGRNRRIRRLVNGAATHGFLYQGQLRPVAELDGAGTLVSRFVYGARAVAPEYLIRVGVTYRLVTDHLGSVHLVVNTTSGAIIQRLDYDAFGQVTLDTNPSFQPFGYAGGLYDPLTGLVRFGVRDYDATIGRWLSKDPIDFQAGDSNLYAYVGNDPINSVDPTGLVIWDVIDLIFFGQDLAAFVQCPGGGTALRVLLGGIGALPGIPSLGWLRTADAVVEEGIRVYRVWGDRAGPWGQSWTTVNPSSITHFRSAAGLPDANTGRFVSEGILTTTKNVTLRPSLIVKPGQQGGLPELMIKNAEQVVRLLRVSGVNPKY